METETLDSKYKEDLIIFADEDDSDVEEDDDADDELEDDLEDDDNSKEGESY